VSLGYGPPFAANKRVVSTSKNAEMSDPHKKRLRKQAKKAQRRAVAESLERNGRHSRKKRPKKN